MPDDLGPSTPPSTAPTSPTSPTSTDGLVDHEKGIAADAIDEKPSNHSQNDAVNGQHVHKYQLPCRTDPKY